MSSKARTLTQEDPPSKKFHLILGIIVFLITIAGAVYALDSRYAKTERLAQLETRFEIKVIEDRVFSLKKRIWTLEDRYGPNVHNVPEYRDLVEEYDSEKKKLDHLYNLNFKTKLP